MVRIRLGTFGPVLGVLYSWPLRFVVILLMYAFEFILRFPSVSSACGLTEFSLM